MLVVMLVCLDKDSFSELESALSQNDDVHLLWSESVNEALDLAAEKTIDLVIADERLGEKTGLELIADLISINPMITYAVVSELASGEFHEASEGLGIMAQLPIRPGKAHAESLLHQLRQIKSLTGGKN